MRAPTIMLSGFLVLGLAGTAEATSSKHEGHAAVPACGKNTSVARPNDEGIITLKEKKRRGCVIAVKALHPTQAAVGMDAVECKSEKISSKAKAGKLDEHLLEDNHWVPMVRGPGGVFYLTDHHHLSAAVWNGNLKDKEMKVYAFLLADWSKMKEDAFWQQMVKQHATWLRDPGGQDITHEQLPKNIGSLQDDPLRTLSAWVRASCGYVKCDPPGVAKADDELSCADKFPNVTCADAYFLEFKWGAYLAGVPEVREALAGDVSCSQHQPLNTQCLDSQYERLTKALPAAMKAAAAPAALQAVGDGAGYNPAVQTGIAQPKHCK